MGFNTISWRHISLDMGTAYMFNQCSLGWWQFVSSLFISVLLEQKYLSIFASPMWTPHGQKREQRNSSHPRSTSSDSSSPSPRPARAIRMTSGACLHESCKATLFSFPWICPVVSQPVRACQLIKAPDFSGPSLSYIGFRKTLRRISLVPMITAEQSPRSGVLCSAKSSTSVSCEYMWTFIRYWQLLQHGGS